MLLSKACCKHGLWVPAQELENLRLPSLEALSTCFFFT
jgi:hypothetical protein